MVFLQPKPALRSEIRNGAANPVAPAEHHPPITPGRQYCVPNFGRLGPSFSRHFHPVGLWVISPSYGFYEGCIIVGAPSLLMNTTGWRLDRLILSDDFMQTNDPRRPVSPPDPPERPNKDPQFRQCQLEPLGIGLGYPWITFLFPRFSCLLYAFRSDIL